MGRCLAVEQIHEDEVADSYGAAHRTTIQNAEVVLYRRHGKWLWEYADEAVA